PWSWGQVMRVMPVVSRASTTWSVARRRRRASGWELVMRSPMSSMRFSRVDAEVVWVSVVMVMAVPCRSRLCSGRLFPNRVTEFVVVAVGWLGGLPGSGAGGGGGDVAELGVGEVDSEAEGARGAEVVDESA